MIAIGKTRIDTNVLLAPLSGISDLSFRLIAREHGAKFCFFEMVDSNSLVRGNARKALSIIRTDSRDMPVAAQILGEDPDIMLKAARMILDTVDTPFLDVNAACPAKKVVKKGAGASLLANQDNLFKIIERLVSSLPVPITVKLRTGFEKPDPEEIIKIASGCESRGVAAIFIHGRTSIQGYAGEVDYESIRAVKSAVKVPVIASGNIFNERLAKEMFDKTACDGILVARGALGNPWIFGQIQNYLSNCEPPQPVSLSVKKEVLLRHLAYMQEYKDLPPYGKVGFMRKFVMWYLKGLPRATRVRERVCLVKTYEEMSSLVKDFEIEKVAVA